MKGVEPRKSPWRRKATSQITVVFEQELRMRSNHNPRKANRGGKAGPLSTGNRMDPEPRMFLVGDHSIQH
jgi:hypothetical protein